MVKQRIVSREEWLKERKALLELEKSYTRAGDEIADKRRNLPCVKLSKDYSFQGPQGKEVTLSDLFGKQSQLVVYHFMFSEDSDKPCPSCSFWADHLQASRRHLLNRDVSLVAVSIAPFSKLEAWAKKAGWDFPWFSSEGSTFNVDFGVTMKGEEGETYNYKKASRNGEMPGLSTFLKSEEGILHCYSTFGRGLEPGNCTYGILDLCPKGRDEGGLTFPMAWVKRLADSETNEQNDNKRPRV